MAKGDKKIDEAFLYVSEKKYPDGTMWQLTLLAQYLQHLEIGIVLFLLCQIILQNGWRPFPCLPNVLMVFAESLFKVMIK